VITFVNAGLDEDGADVVAVDMTVTADRVGLEFGMLALSRLERGDPEATRGLFGGCTGDSVCATLSSVAEVGVGAFRDKNDSKPPGFFDLLKSELPEAVCPLSLSTTRQPAGSRSSCEIIGLDFTSASQAVDPFDARKCDRGLSFVDGEFLVRRMASAMCFAVTVLPNWAGGGIVMSSGGRYFSMAIDLSGRKYGHAAA
jgi:hypothetical protein